MSTIETELGQAGTNRARTADGAHGADAPNSVDRKKNADTPDTPDVRPGGTTALRQARLLAIRARGRRLVFAQSMDALTFLAFYVLVGPTIHAERNPLILALMALGGIQLVALAKIGLAWLVARRMRQPARPSRFRLIRAAYPVLSIVMISLAVASGIVGAGFNTAALLDTIIR